jgi:hypothetical protein
MSNVNWSSVQQWIQSNPNKNKCLTPFVFEKDSIEGTVEQKGADGWSKVHISPATPLGAILMAQDPLYHASSESSRRAFLRDETTDLQEKAILHLKGRAWPVRRTAEGIVACGLEEGRASSWSDMGWRALCELRECQLIIINEEKKEIKFYPEDTRKWSSSVDTFCIEFECRTLWTHPQANQVLYSWLLSKEIEEWKMDWPIVDGTVDELRSIAAKLGDTLPPKILKEALQKRIGKLESFNLFQQWNAQEN